MLHVQLKLASEMKQSCLILIALCTALCAKSQTFTFNSGLTVDYTMYLNFNGSQKYQATLHAGKSASLFTYQWRNNASKNESTNDFPGVNHNKKVYISDTTTFSIASIRDTLYSLNKGFDNNLYYLKEAAPNFNWAITSKTKKIENITCHLATTTFRGRTYNAWYAPSIPIKYGPYKFSGLPGLILAINDTENDVIFRARKISYQKKEIDASLTPSYDVLGLTDYLELRKKRMSTIRSKLEKLRARMPKGSSMSIDAMELNEIERDFDHARK